jgi:hypothetical protein
MCSKDTSRPMGSKPPIQGILRHSRTAIAFSVPVLIHEVQKVGLCHQKILVESVESLTLALYTRVLRYSEEEVRDMIKGVIEELVGAFRNESSMFTQFFFVYGRKP